MPKYKHLVQNFKQSRYGQTGHVSFAVNSTALTALVTTDDLSA
jgi:hypothetical protein